MQLYDDVILSLNNLINGYSDKTKELKQESDWNDIGKHNMVLRSDMAFELGGSESQFSAIGGTAVTSNSELLSSDQILLIGQDISEIKEETPYARISIVRVNSETMGEGNSLFKAVKAIDYTRYHVSPEGYMMRVSAIQDRESVRVSKDAVKKGISFSDVGSLMLKSFHKNTNVQAAKIIFITLPDFPYDELAKLVKKTDKITKTIDHISSNSMVDCSVCSLKPVCDEVEGMRELHFNNKSE